METKTLSFFDDEKAWDNGTALLNYMTMEQLEELSEELADKVKRALKEEAHQKKEEVKEEDCSITSPPEESIMLQSENKNPIEEDNEELTEEQKKLRDFIVKTFGA